MSNSSRHCFPYVQGRDSAIVFLEGNRLMALASALMEEMNAGALSPERSKAVVRALQWVQLESTRTQSRATELTQQVADEMLADVQRRRDGP